MMRRGSRLDEHVTITDSTEQQPEQKRPKTTYKQPQSGRPTRQSPEEELHDSSVRRQAGRDAR